MLFVTSMSRGFGVEREDVRWDGRDVGRGGIHPSRRRLWGRRMDAEGSFLMRPRLRLDGELRYVPVLSFVLSVLSSPASVLCPFRFCCSVVHAPHCFAFVSFSSAHCYSFVEADMHLDIPSLYISASHRRGEGEPVHSAPFFFDLICLPTRTSEESKLPARFSAEDKVMQLGCLYTWMDGEGWRHRPVGVRYCKARRILPGPSAYTPSRPAFGPAHQPPHSRIFLLADPHHPSSIPRHTLPDICSLPSRSS
ncbi:hypothetical protein R3P38DRAFT_3153613 [Favolaschia claudopus]|uniref:Uncharacterized protein n=1 Tax=Favolaschia claudopus TaxID=2862362 RepID=A0AAV9Z025_9AGAR